MNSLASLAAILSLGTAAAQDIEVRQLGSLDPLEVGVATNGLGENLWAGSTVQTALNALEGLPASSAEYRSPARANLVALALLSGGTPPQGGRGNNSLASLRADRLLAASGAEAVYSLLERTPGLDRAPDLARLHAEAAFALAANEAACRTTNGLVIGRDQPYWLRARAFCHALAGEAAAAELSADLARVEEADANFDGLLYAITIGRWTVDEASADTGLDWALAAVSPTEGRPVVDLSDAPGWLVDVAEASSALPDLTAEPALALEGLSMQEGAARAQTLEQLIYQDYDRLVAAQALGLAFIEADRNNDFMRAARRYGRQVATLPVTFETMDHAGRFALAALSVGDIATATRWREALENGPPARTPVYDPTKPDDLIGAIPQPDQAEWNPPSPAYMVALDLAFRIAQNQVRRSSTDALVQARLESGASGLGDVAGLAGLGISVPPDFRLALFNAEPETVSPMLAAMDAAAMAGARAETALLAAQILDDGPSGASPMEMMRITGALDRVGLRDIALSVVLERIIVELA
ncbi:hypothetical protein [Hyphobacterium lacteum]|nr:hypothetical protein [Hyphobacterium sp. HN65]